MQARLRTFDDWDSDREGNVFIDGYTLQARAGRDANISVFHAGDRSYFVLAEYPYDDFVYLGYFDLAYADHMGTDTIDSEGQQVTVEDWEEAEYLGPKGFKLASINIAKRLSEYIY